MRIALIAQHATEPGGEELDETLHVVVTAPSCEAAIESAAGPPTDRQYWIVALIDLDTLQRAGDYIERFAVHRSLGTGANMRVFVGEAEAEQLTVEWHFDGAFDLDHAREEVEKDLREYIGRAWSVWVVVGPEGLEVLQ